MSAHQQVGDFVARNVNGTVVKQGGNVASYFCTPTGRVIHAVVGPVGADELLKEAQWAVDHWNNVKDMHTLEDQQDQLSVSHDMEFRKLGGGTPPQMRGLRGIPLPGVSVPGKWGGALAKLIGTQPQKVHQLLSERPLAPLEEVYVEVFEHILGERISKAAPNVQLAEQGLQHAEQEGRPMLFILHSGHDNTQFTEQWLAYLKAQQRNSHLLGILRQCVVIVLPQREMPALSHRLKQEPYSVPSNGSPLFVVTDARGKQLDSLAGWESLPKLTLPLAKAVVHELKLAPPQNLQKLRETAAFLRRIDVALASEIQPLIKEAEENRKKEKESKKETPAKQVAAE